jgi:Ser/Thr protein kinase RdoA (MazF antagonist)
MFVKTEEIKLEPVLQEENYWSAILENAYGFELIPGTLSRFTEKTAASKVYKAEIKKVGPVVIKLSFWYYDMSAALKLRRIYERAYQLSEELRKRGVALAPVFKNKEGLYVSLVGTHYLTVSAFAEGNHFSSRDEEFASSGAALGVFHREGAAYLKDYPEETEAIPREIPVEKPYEDSRPLYEKSLRAELVADHGDCAAKEICAAIRNQIGEIDKAIAYVDASGVNAKERSSGILHNDFHTNNALFLPDGKLSIFLDIDQIGVGPHIWDVGNTLFSYGSNFLKNHTAEEFALRVAAFLRAYHKEFPLPLPEYKLILAAGMRWDLMRILRSIRRHRYENNRLPDLLPKIKDRLIPRLIGMPRIFQFLTEDWLRKNFNI